MGVPTRQKIIISCLVVLAFGALILAATYQEESRLPEATITDRTALNETAQNQTAQNGTAETQTTETPTAVAGPIELGGQQNEDGQSGDSSQTGQDNQTDAGDSDEPTASNPIEAWLPKSGQGSTCSEPIGVDLLPGYAATLTINGQTISTEQMNPNILNQGVGDNGQALPGAASLGEFSYGPEASCPTGAILRPKDNVLVACVFKVEKDPSTCQVYQTRFDAL